MKYAVNYNSNFKNYEKIDEVIIKYSNEQQKLELLNFIKQITIENLRVVIAAEQLKTLSSEDIALFTQVVTIHPGTAVRIGLHQKDFFFEFLNNEIPYFFDAFVDSWDMFNAFVKLGVSDIYVVNEFAFHLKEIKEVVKNDVNIRIFPNVCQSSDSLKVLPTETSFFIRPEDIINYEPFVDVCEFFGPSDRNKVLFEIYKSGRWLGDLGHLIIGLNQEVSNQSIAPSFGIARAKCNKVCTKTNCTICQQSFNLAKKLDEAGMGFKEVLDDRTE